MNILDNWPAGSDLLMAVLAWLMTYALHSTVLLGAVWILIRFAATTPERIRDGLWKLAMVGGVVTATTQVGMGVQPFGGRLFLLTNSEIVEPVAEVLPATEVSAPVADALEPHEFVPAPILKPRTVPVSKDVVTDRKPTERIKRDLFPSHLVELESEPHLQHAGENTFFEKNEVERRAERTRNSRQVSELKRRASQADSPRQPLAVVAKPTPVEDSFVEEERSTIGLTGTTNSNGPAAGSKQLAASPWLLLPWLVSIVLAGFVVALALVQLRKVLHRRRPLVEGPVAELFADLLRRSGVKRNVRLSTSSELDAPITFGIVFAEISIPSRALTELDAKQQEAMLAHELGHAVRRDPLWHLISKAMVAAFFFQPLNRIARKEMLDLAEYLSDDWAVAHTGRELSLASCLTEVARWIVGSPKPLLAPGMAGGSRLSTRVHRLLDSQRERPQGTVRVLKPTAMGFVGLLAFAGVVPGIAAVSLEPELLREAELDPKVAVADVQRVDDLHRVEDVERVDELQELREDAVHLARLEAEREQARTDSQSITTSLLHIIQRTLKTLDLEIEELIAETEALRAAISKLEKSNHLIESVELIESRIFELSEQREALAVELPRLIRMIGNE